MTNIEHFNEMVRQAMQLRALFKSMSVEEILSEVGMAFMTCGDLEKPTPQNLRCIVYYALLAEMEKRRLDRAAFWYADLHTTTDEHVRDCEAMETLSALSEMERTVLTLTADGFSTREIGSKLGWSHESVAAELRRLRNYVCA